MTGIRVVVGYGKLDRNFSEKISELPRASEGGLQKTPKDIIEGNLLKGRFGAGVEVTINRNRNLDYKRDLGFREITMVTPGMYDLEFSMSGYLSTADFGWMENLFINTSLTITDEIECYDYKGVALTNPLFLAANDVYLKLTADPCSKMLRIDKASFSYYMAMMLVKGTETYSAAGVVGAKQTYVISQKDFNCLKEDAAVRGTASKMNVKICGPGRLSKLTDYTFDLGTVQNNLQASRGKSDEIGVLCGCVITSGSFSYEATGDTGVKFTLDGIALRDYIQLSKSCVDYLAHIDEINADIFATGCLYISKKPGDVFEEIAHTDGASLTLSNKVEKLAECGELIYGGLALGTVDVELSVQTYSNDPNRYIPIMYGMKDPMVAGATIYSMQKLPKPTNAFRIRSCDKTEIHRLSKFIDVMATNVYIGGMNKAYSNESKIMDEPTLKPTTAWIAVGYEKAVVIP